MSRKKVIYYLKKLRFNLVALTSWRLKKEKNTTLNLFLWRGFLINQKRKTGTYPPASPLTSMESSFHFLQIFLLFLRKSTEFPHTVNSSVKAIDIIFIGNNIRGTCKLEEALTVSNRTNYVLENGITNQCEHARFKC